MEWCFPREMTPLIYSLNSSDSRFWTSVELSTTRLKTQSEPDLKICANILSLLIIRQATHSWSRWTKTLRSWECMTPSMIRPMVSGMIGTSRQHMMWLSWHKSAWSFRHSARLWRQESMSVRLRETTASRRTSLARLSQGTSGKPLIDCLGALRVLSAPRLESLAPQVHALPDTLRKTTIS